MLYVLVRLVVVLRDEGGGEELHLSRSEEWEAQETVMRGGMTLGGRRPRGAGEPCGRTGEEEEWEGKVG